MNRDTLHALFDGELPPDEAARARDALRADPDAEAELRALEAAHEALDALPAAAAPPGLAARVLARARRRARLVRLAAPTAAAAAALLLTLLLRPGAPGGAAGEGAREAPEYFWEGDVDTYGSLALRDLAAEVLEELEAS